MHSKHRPRHYHLAGARELAAGAHRIERLGAPQTIEILVEITRAEGMIGIEGAVGPDIGEAEGKLARARAGLKHEQGGERVGAADLVAMGEESAGFINGVLDTIRGRIESEKRGSGS